ncbi:MAG: RNA-binding domain-containing protein [Acidimicrobiia bacterium]
METALLIFGIIVGGFVLGSIARFIVPGHQPFSLAETTIMGMVGAAIGAIASNLIFGADTMDDIRPGSIIGAVAGSVLVLGVATWAGDHFGWRKAVPPASSVVDLIAAGESDSVEFKSTARWNVHTNAKDDRMELTVAKTVAGFLNSDGGLLIIGVDDDGNAVGLDNDLSTMKAPDHDRYQLWLIDHLEKALGKPAVAFVTVSFEPFQAHDVVLIHIDPSDRPVFLNETKGGRTADFYVRMGNSTRKLLTDEFADYQQSRWT